MTTLLVSLAAVSAAVGVAALVTGRVTLTAVGGLSGGWRETTFFRLRDAERFLDRLENQAPGRRELKVVGNSRFVVRWLP